MTAGAGRAHASAPSEQPSVLAPVRMRSAGETVADRLVTAIALGEFVPGQRLPTERDLSAMLGVSRATVREALQRLAALEYVEIRRGRTGGAFVQAGWGPEAAEMISRTLLPGWEGFERLLDFRQLVEPLIARTAAERRTRTDVPAIEAALAAYQEAGTDRSASRVADEAMHVAIAQAAHNPYLTQLSAQIRREISLGFGAEPYTLRIRARAVKDHAALAAAVIGGEPTRAASIAAKHFRLTERMLRELIARVGEGRSR